MSAVLTPAHRDTMLVDPGAPPVRAAAVVLAELRNQLTVITTVPSQLEGCTDGHEVREFWTQYNESCAHVRALCTELAAAIGGGQ